MQRFEQLQPGLTRIPQGELQPFLIESQALHERFLELQAQSQTTGPSALEAWQQQRLLPFRDDLAAFVERVETRLGTQPQGGIPQCGGGGVGALGAASFGQQPSGAFGASSFGQQPRGAIPDGPTNLRLQSSMQKIQGGMQRFEALHPQLRNADPQLFNRVADRGQQLHEEFMELQRTGVELESSNTPSHQADMEAYLARLDRFVPGMLDFVTGVEDSLRNSGGGGRQMGSFGSSSPGFGGAGGVPPVSPGMPQRAFAASGGFGGAGAAGVGAGSITPATDQSLSGVIQQLTDLMQEFQAMRPQISQLPPSRLAPVGQQGEVLDERFRQLQLRGAAIAGDGTQPMMEAMQRRPPGAVPVAAAACRRRGRPVPSAAPPLSRPVWAGASAPRGKTCGMVVAGLMLAAAVMVWRAASSVCCRRPRAPNSRAWMAWIVWAS
mmetsp:Transcript_96750/g.311847  ORF Transcript_96750/g.311847 Transcript_96750/m.311847 type:complete len:437 (+) Transcript_96750:2678-3988(+)